MIGQGRIREHLAGSDKTLTETGLFGGLDRVHNSFHGVLSFTQTTVYTAPLRPAPPFLLQQVVQREQIKRNDSTTQSIIFLQLRSIGEDHFEPIHRCAWKAGHSDEDRSNSVSHNEEPIFMHCIGSNAHSQVNNGPRQQSCHKDTTLYELTIDILPFTSLLLFYFKHKKLQAKVQHTIMA